MQKRSQALTSNGAAHSGPLPLCRALGYGRDLKGVRERSPRVGRKQEKGAQESRGGRERSSLPWAGFHSLPESAPRVPRGREAPGAGRQGRSR